MTVTVNSFEPKILGYAYVCRHSRFGPYAFDEVYATRKLESLSITIYRLPAPAPPSNWIFTQLVFWGW